MWDTLTPELIFEIMRHFLPDMKLSVVDSALFPWYLGHICKAWRDVFITSPQFWCTLHFRLTCQWDVSLGHFERALETTTVSLQRSRGHPISFMFRMGKISSNPKAICCRQILETIMAHSTRWRDAYFILHVDVLQTLYSVKHRLPMLRSIQVKLIQGETEFPTTFSDLFTDAPQLTRVSIDRRMPWKINWSSVTVIYVDLQGSFSQEVLPYLDQACRLEELVLKFLFVSAISFDTITPPIKLASLKVLYVVFVNSLLFFETPALEELLIRNEIVPVRGISYETIISRFFSPLRRLRRLTLFAPSTHNAEHFFQYMPIVQHISLRSNDELLHVLSRSPNARHLEVVTFDWWHFGGHNEELLRNLILSWKSHVSGGIGPFENLARISFGFDPGSDLEDHLIEQGVKCTVRSDLSGFAHLPRFEDYSALYTYA